MTEEKHRSHPGLWMAAGVVFVAVITGTLWNIQHIDDAADVEDQDQVWTHPVDHSVEERHEVGQGRRVAQGGVQSGIVLESLANPKTTHRHDGDTGFSLSVPVPEGLFEVPQVHLGADTVAFPRAEQRITLHMPVVPEMGRALEILPRAETLKPKTGGMWVSSLRDRHVLSQMDETLRDGPVRHLKQTPWNKTISVERRQALDMEWGRDLFASPSHR